MTLDELALKHGTDKSSKYHDYCKAYEQLFQPLKSKPITLLEIGVYKGESLRMWKEFFSYGMIVGVDIDPECKQYEDSRIIIEIADQQTYKTWHKPDIIIDDGSHNPDHFIKTFRNLWPSLNPGGHYCIEDLSVCNHCNYPKRYSESLSEFMHDDIFNFLTGANRQPKAIMMFAKLLVFKK